MLFLPTLVGDLPRTTSPIGQGKKRKEILQFYPEEVLLMQTQNN